MTSGCSYLSPADGTSQRLESKPDEAPRPLPSLPLLARITGLPGGTLAPLSSPLCASYLEERRALEGRLAGARAALTEVIFRLLPAADPGSRRFLLSIKRACFNQREIRQHRGDPQWIELRCVSGCLAEEIAEFEARLHELDSSFEGLYARERDRERSHLLAAVDDGRFVRGIALGSPELVSRARELRQGPVRWGRRERKVEQSLARFVTRAAAKLSPNSTLTPMALCRVGGEPGGLRFLPGEPRREKSLLRANRSLLDQCCAILFWHPPVRARCLVSLNDTLEEIEPRRYRYLRPGSWSFDPRSGQLRFLSASQVKATLTEPLVPAVFELLAAGPTTYEDLASRMLARADVEAEAAVRPVLDNLISLGVLLLLPPWPTYEPHVERRLQRLLSALPPDPVLQPVLGALDRLLAGESDYQRESDPADAAQALQGAIQGLLEAVLEPWDRDSEAVYQTKDRHWLYEDVFLLAATGERALLEISSPALEDIMATAKTLFRFAHLYSHRHDVLHNLAALWQERWPERSEIGALELFFSLRDFWNGYLAFDLEHRDRLFSSFNPLDLAAIRELDELRAAIYKGTQDLMREGAAEWELDPGAFARLLDGIPSRYSPAVGPCVFVQPATAAGDLWVLNRLFEGTGRYGSRFFAAMESWMPAGFLERLTANSVLSSAAGPLYLLDLMYSQGSTSNARIPQIFKVLEMPGERLDLPAERRVRLRDLRVRADLARGTFELVAAQDRRCIPVHLSSISNIYMPVVLRFLSLFGPYEVRQVVPRPRPARQGAVTFSDRLTCGNLVIRRRRWVLEQEGFPQDEAKLSPAEAFTRMHAWRCRQGLPQQVFLYEMMRSPEGAEVFKPQYLDFSSPALVSLFQASLKNTPKRLIFEEPLPLHTSFPTGFENEKWGLELQIDSICLLAGEDSARSQSSLP